MWFNSGIKNPLLCALLKVRVLLTPNLCLLNDNSPLNLSLQLTEMGQLFPRNVFEGL